MKRAVEVAKQPAVAGFPKHAVPAPRFFDVLTTEDLVRWRVLALAAYVEAMQDVGRVVVVRKGVDGLRFASIAEPTP